jgi:LysR family nitrogen assimilation transcriptional regulator
MSSCGREYVELSSTLRVLVAVESNAFDGVLIRYAPGPRLHMSILLHASLRDIVLFVAAYEERSFTRASEREGATQSGVSQHIKKLEASFNVELFVRDASRLRPTPAADGYYRHCIELLRRYELSARELREFRGELSGEVKVGFMATITRSALTPTLIRFTELHPNVRLSVIETHSRLLAERVESGELDFAVVPTHLEQKGVRRTFFMRTEEVLVTARQNGHCAPTPVNLRAIEKLKLIVPSRYNARRDALDRYLAAASVPVWRQMELDVVFTTLDIVAQSDWKAVLPVLTLSAEDAASRITLRPLESPLWFDMDLIEPQCQTMSPAAAAFAELLRSSAASANERALRDLRS